MQFVFAIDALKIIDVIKVFTFGMWKVLTEVNYLKNFSNISFYRYCIVSQAYL